VSGVSTFVETSPHLRIKSLAVTRDLLTASDTLDSQHALSHLLSQTSASKYIVSPEIAQKALGLSSPPRREVLAEVQLPQSSFNGHGRRWLLMNGVSDPGNMGTLIRSAFGFRWDGVLSFNSSCNPFNNKVVRASKGAVFRLPLTTNSSDFQSFCAQQEEDERPQCIVADMAPPEILSKCSSSSNGIVFFKQEVLSPADVERLLKKKIVLVLNSEAHGSSWMEGKGGLPSDYVKAAVIMPGGAESLNVAVAGSILLHHLGSRMSL
jgi:TrmH family RNA methyltransferase